jgi:hypothetical protein
VQQGEGWLGLYDDDDDDDDDILHFCLERVYMLLNCQGI